MSRYEGQSWQSHSGNHFGGLEKCHFCCAPFAISVSMSSVAVTLREKIAIKK